MPRPTPRLAPVTRAIRPLSAPAISSPLNDGPLLTAASIIPCASLGVVELNQNPTPRGASGRSPAAILVEESDLVRVGQDKSEQLYLFNKMWSVMRSIKA
jgi:hypothetical protein